MSIGQVASYESVRARPPSSCVGCSTSCMLSFTIGHTSSSTPTKRHWQASDIRDAAWRRCLSVLGVAAQLDLAIESTEVLRILRCWVLSATVPGYNLCYHKSSWRGTRRMLPYPPVFGLTIERVVSRTSSGTDRRGGFRRQFSESGPLVCGSQLRVTIQMHGSYLSLTVLLRILTVRRSLTCDGLVFSQCSCPLP